MKKRLIIAAAVAVLLLAVAFVLYGPSRAPAGQPPLTRLSPADFHEFEAAFDADVAAPRLVLLLSPT